LDFRQSQTIAHSQCGQTGLPERVNDFDTPGFGI
jgi:hypothetical protein